jgi:shikimate dehydrogenase
MTKRAAVLGHPISHSLSPLIHNAWIKKYGIDARYDAIDIAPGKLGEMLRRLADEGYAGFNVTLPHKVAVMEHCGSIDAVAQAIGAVNTVVIRDGQMHGTNTDAFGFMANLKEQCPVWRGEDGPALVLGAGGAAKAVLYALQKEGVPEIILINRTQGKARDLGAGEKHITVMPWEQRHEVAKNARLIINTTSLGMSGQERLEMDLSGTDAVVYDIVYRPLMTPLLLQAQQRNQPVVTGLGMLLHQARPAFEHWFGVMPEVDDALVNMATRAAAGP